MRHIKQYEALTNIKLKRYCIWDSIIHLEIIEIVDVVFDTPQYNTEYVSIMIYKYDNNILIKTEKEGKISFYENSIDRFIKYTSDNLQDCIDMLPILYDTQKYNL